MNQNLFEHQLPALGANSNGRYAKLDSADQSAPADPDRRLDEFLSLMDAQHDSAAALHEVHKQALKAAGSKTVHAIYDQAHAAIADHFGDLHADKPDWSQSLRQDLDADRNVHRTQLRAAAGPARLEAAKQKVGAVLTNYARMAAEGDAGRFGDRARRTVLAGAAAGLYPPEEAKTRFDDFASEVERFKREQAQNVSANEPRQLAPGAGTAPETTKSLQTWAGQLAERERKRMLGDPEADGGDLSAEIERYTDALVHASPESKPVLQHLTMLLFSKFHDNAATGQLSDFIDDFADSPLTPRQRRESLLTLRFLDRYLNETQLNQTLNTKNAFSNLALALGAGVLTPSKVGLPATGAKPGIVPTRPPEVVGKGSPEPAAPPNGPAGALGAKEPAAPLAEAVNPRPLVLKSPNPQGEPQPPAKLAFDDNDPAAIQAYFKRPVAGNEGPDGHVTSRHLFKTVDQLAERFKRDPKIPASSAFNDAATAERVIHDTLLANQAKIMNWLRNPRSKQSLELSYKGQNVVGISVMRDGTVVHRRNAIVRVKKDNRGGFYYNTAFPDE